MTGEINKNDVRTTKELFQIGLPNENQDETSIYKQLGHIHTTLIYALSDYKLFQREDPAKEMKFVRNSTNKDHYLCLALYGITDLPSIEGFDHSIAHKLPFLQADLEIILKKEPTIIRIIADNPVGRYDIFTK